MEDSAVIGKRSREEYDSAVPDESDSPAVKRLKEDLLGGSDDEGEFCEASEDLDSFVKSFQEEITASPAAGVDPASDCSETRPDLGYLLEASDDELGLPPTTVVSGSEPRPEFDRVESESSELIWDLPSYDPFGFGFGEVGADYGAGGGEYAALDGLFDHSDLGFGSGDFEYRAESLPAQ
ncbi:1-pyrroline-5-carboxylate dehydrogenase 2 [Striga asiatica]|uniref:1-pyrroline-5-carboxylate dehydrogenase 2 n=1 Tax=Striga asiatica TaxID=4170 RepID=A0A5A7PIT6_STRAF|nr:1-pyrroline-5-carboxylate dehydrogenase 2 [Striga asiatica]